MHIRFKIDINKFNFKIYLKNEKKCRNKVCEVSGGISSLSNIKIRIECNFLLGAKRGAPSMEGL